MSWHTKEDVLDDLAEVMGNEINDFDEQYILRGEQPPPPACTSNEVDDELYLMLNRELGDRHMNEDGRGPDLSGITKMLRMVDEFHRLSDIENGQLLSESSSSTGISITKLNVNVPELVPINNINYENASVDRLSSEQTLDQEKIKDISDKLKGKIGSCSKTNNLKMKRERNLAIASLLKLHSNENAIETTPKLITPEHFEKNSSARLNDKSSQSSSKQLTSLRPLLQVENVECAVETTEEANNMNQELEESVAKVNSWLNEGRDKQLETTGPAPYLGPVTFRKKEINKTKSLNSEVSDKSTKRMIDNNSFIPSEYADKLTQSYMERVKEKMISQDIWSKLERDLKVKDKEILSKCHLSTEQSSQLN